MIPVARIRTARLERVRRLAEEWEAEDRVRVLGPRPLPWVLVLALMTACAAGAAPAAPQERQDDLCAEIVDAHCQRAEECRGTSYELCVTGVDQYCPAWRPEPECVEDIWTAECTPEMGLPCSCGTGSCP